MPRSFLAGAALALAALAAAPIVRAQTPAPPPVPDGPRYVVSYVEVKPNATADTVRIVRRYRDASRGQPGNLRAEALRRFGQSNQFVMLTAWKDQAAADAHAKSPAAAKFRDEIRAIEIAPIDERVHFPLSVGAPELKTKGATIAVVTHVDVIPPQREHGTAIVRDLAERSRKEAGNQRFEALVQTNRQNHFSLVEQWRDRKAADDHAVAGHTRAFREKLAPATGALFDERIYRVLP